MESIKVFDDLQMFNSYLGFIDLTFNQYLLLCSEPLLIHTGSREHAVEMLPKLKAALGEMKLSYVFISHFESDECGGLSLLKEYFPEARLICSQVTARQLMGFGIAAAADIITKAPGDVLEAGDFRLKFISYPSEMHLWEGLMAFEEKRGILFSSDIFIRRGKLESAVVDSNIQKEITGISMEQIPSPAGHEKFKKALYDMPVKYIAPGHGPCLRV